MLFKTNLQQDLGGTLDSTFQALALELVPADMLEQHMMLKSKSPVRYYIDMSGRHRTPVPNGSRLCTVFHGEYSRSALD